MLFCPWYFKSRHPDLYKQKTVVSGVNFYLVLISQTKHGKKRRIHWLYVPGVCDVVVVSGQDEPPGEQGEPQHHARHHGEHHRHQQVDEEGDEGAEAEDDDLGDNEKDVGGEPGQQEPPPVEDDGGHEEEGEDEVEAGEQEQEAQEHWGVLGVRDIVQEDCYASCYLQSYPD